MDNKTLDIGDINLKIKNVMKMQEESKLKKFNTESSQVKNVNNIKLVTTNNESKLSVVLSPDEQAYMGYHGLHPSFGENELRDFLKTDNINDGNIFWEEIKLLQKKDPYKMKLILHKDFNKMKELDKSDFEFFDKERISDLELILLGRAILHMASHFGFIFRFKDEKIKEDILKCARLYRGEYLKIEASDKNILFKGILPKELIEMLSEKYSYCIDKNELLITEYNSSNSLSDILSFKKDFSNHFKMLDTNVYYSGVMPKVMGVEIKDNYNRANEIKTVILHVARTTYATVDFMDNPGTLKHDFFDNDRKRKMIEFDNYEDRIQQRYLYNDSSLENEIERLNEYLKYSFNTHTVAVSANIETIDGFLILGKRDEKSIDAGEYYCSVNGQSEFRDENVSFYRESVFEDLPSMEYSSKYRVDLNQEIQRECIAELGVSQFKDNWTYYGISYLSINNFLEDKEITKENSESVLKRRMHFNVLSGNTTSFTFEEVLKGHKNATEKFENSKIKGIKIHVHNDIKSFAGSIFSDFIKWIYRTRSDIFLIAIFILSSIKNAKINELNFINLIEVVIVSLYVILIGFEYKKQIKINKLRIKTRFINSKYVSKNLSWESDNKLNLDVIFKNLNKKMSKGKLDSNKTYFNVIFLVMYTLYFREKCSDIE